MQPGVVGVLAGDDDDPAARGGVRRRAPRARPAAPGTGAIGVVGVERPEPVTGRARPRPRRRWPDEQVVERRARAARSSPRPGSRRRARRRARAGSRRSPGTVSIRVMSRSKPTTSGASARGRPGMRARRRQARRAAPQSRCHCDAGPSCATMGSSRPARRTGDVVSASEHGACGARRWPCAARSPRPRRRSAAAVRRRLRTRDRRDADGPPGSTSSPSTDPGTSGLPRRPSRRRSPRRRCAASRTRVLGRGRRRPTPVYRWTTALNGFAVRLTAAQAGDARRRPARGAGRAERRPPPGRRRPGTHRPALDRAGPPARRRRHGRSASSTPASGPRARSSPTSRGLGRAPRDFRGDLRGGAGLGRPAAATASSSAPAGSSTASAPTGSAASSSLSAARRRRPRHPDGLDRRRQRRRHACRCTASALGSYGGVAPQARLAVYKACWTAPDPRRRRLLDRRPGHRDRPGRPRDRVDVLNLSVGGPPDASTPSSAPCSARPRPTSSWSPPPATTAPARTPRTPARGSRPSAAPPAPSGAGAWSLAGGPRSTGAMASTRGAGPARVVLGATGRRPRGDHTRAARVCRRAASTPSRVAGAIVLCERGTIGRVDKSAAVDAADGVGMVLANTAPGQRRRRLPQRADRPPRPRPTAARCGTGCAAHPRGRVSLRPVGVERPPARARRVVRRRRPDRRRRSSPTWSRPASASSAPSRRRVREHPLGLRVRDLGRRPRTPAARAALLRSRHDWPASRGPLGPGDHRRPRRRRPLGAAQRRRPGPVRTARPPRRLVYPVEPARLPRLAGRAIRPRAAEHAVDPAHRPASPRPAGPSPTWAGARCTSPPPRRGFTRHTVRRCAPPRCGWRPARARRFTVRVDQRGRGAPARRRLGHLARRQRHERADPGAAQPLTGCSAGTCGHPAAQRCPGLRGALRFAGPRTSRPMSHARPGVLRRRRAPKRRARGARAGG